MNIAQGFLLGAVVIVLLALLAQAGFVVYLTTMPGKSYAGALPPFSAQEAETTANVKKHVFHLAETIGERNLTRYKALQDASQFIEETLKSQGYEVQSQEYAVQGKTVRNLVAEIPGGTRAGEIVVVGAHYDTVFDCPGADDNGSGIAGLLEVARLLKHSGVRPERTLRFVAFVNEEPPYFQTATMGSRVYAKRAREHHDNVVAAISLEMLGTYLDTEGSQQYPSGVGWLYPSKGNFIGFVGNVASRPLVREAVRSFRRTTQFPSQGIAAPEGIMGIGWSDHWSFWQEGYPGIMVTDTAFFRNKNYHMPSDTAGTLDYERMGRVVQGIARVVAEISGAK